MREGKNAYLKEVIGILTQPSKHFWQFKAIVITTYW